MERWKDVDWLPEYRGVLQVSDRGRVRRHSYTYTALGRWGKPHTTTKPDKVLALSNESHGYDVVAVQIDGKRRKLLVHRLVARAFVDGYASELTVNHINGVKTDNRASNLEWVTKAKNTALQWETGLAKPVPKKLSSGQVRIMRELMASGVSPNKLAILAGVDPSLVYKIKKGQRWSEIGH